MRQVLVFSILLSLFNVVSVAGQLVVSPFGDDANDGSREKPLRTLVRARELLRLRLPEQTEDEVVLLRGGDYYLEQPFTLGPEDSGRNGHRVVYRSHPGEQARIVGGRLVDNWSATETPGLFRTKLPKGMKIFQLFENGIRAELARHPNQGYFEVARGVAKRGKDGKVLKNKAGEVIISAKDFHFRRRDIPKDWTDWRGAQVFIWASYDWFSSQRPIKSVDQKARSIHLERDCLGAIVKRPHRRYFLKGVRAALDAPGEFWYDGETGELLYRPRQEDIAKSKIVVPTVSRVLEFKGASVNSPVRNVTFAGVDVSISRFSDSFHETRGTHGNGPWNEPMNKEAAVYFEHAENCAVTDAEIANAGYSGVAMVWSGRGNRVERCQIRDAGFHGVLLSGYRAEFGPEMDCNRDHQIVNNWIHHCGRLVGHGGGIFLHSSGHNRIGNNTIHNMPRYGLCIKGQHFLRKFPTRRILNQNPDAGPKFWTVNEKNQWDFVHSGHNEIRKNDFFLCNEDTEDSGFISTWGAGKGNLIEGNRIRDSYRFLGGLGQAIYLDDESHYFTVRGNLIYNFFGGSSLRLIFTKGTNHLFENNIIVCQHPGSIGFFCMSFRGSKVENIRLRKNLLAMLAPGVPMEFSVNSPEAGIRWQESCVTECDDNLFFAPHSRKLVRVNRADRTLEQWRQEFNGKYASHSRIADPLFQDAAAGDFRFLPGSPARALGIASFDSAACGVQPDFPQRFRRKFQSAQTIPEEVRARVSKSSAPSVSFPKAFSETFDSFDFYEPPFISGCQLFDGGDDELKIVADPMGAKEGKCLAVVNAPVGGKYDPRLLFNLHHSEAVFLFSFDIFLPENRPADMILGIRDYANRGRKEFLSAMELQLRGDGELWMGERKRAMLKPGVWNRLELGIPTGKSTGAGVCTLSVHPRGGESSAVELPIGDSKFKTLTRVVLYCPGQEPGTAYIDNLEWKTIETLKRSE